jgi:hypothetical protein
LLQWGLLDLIPLKLCTHETHSKQNHKTGLLMRAENNSTDPSTGIVLGAKKQLAPNVVLRKMIAQWVEDGGKTGGV